MLLNEFPRFVGSKQNNAISEWKHLVALNDFCFLTDKIRTSLNSHIIFVKMVVQE